MKFIKKDPDEINYEILVPKKFEVKNSHCKL